MRSGSLQPRELRNQPNENDHEDLAAADNCNSPCLDVLRGFRLRFEPGSASPHPARRELRGTPGVPLPGYGLFGSDDDSTRRYGRAENAPLLFPGLSVRLQARRQGEHPGESAWIWFLRQLAAKLFSRHGREG